MSLVTLYTKTYCAYSKRAKALLSEKGVDFEDIDVTEDEVCFSEMVEQSGGCTTVPQIFIAGQHIGGCSELMELDECGELDALLGTGDIVSHPS
ncbi:glutaredoxin 3 [Archangium violaceum]|uniref:glutaredoxin 3 n=1 Tax=Archangium violaceum TaxID=83451 RepID=UPI00194E2E5E|nr:glutaredoxin 3 [Archangium violaceum]QRN93122.1 glutaredoxin 3 [Archangium violaceum]